MSGMRKRLAHALCLLLLIATVCLAAGWRAASEQELRKIIPARAPVIKENIETEFRTASGVTDSVGASNALFSSAALTTAAGTWSVSSQP